MAQTLILEQKTPLADLRGLANFFAFVGHTPRRSYSLL